MYLLRTKGVAPRWKKCLPTQAMLVSVEVKRCFQQYAKVPRGSSFDAGDLSHKLDVV